MQNIYCNLPFWEGPDLLPSAIHQDFCLHSSSYCHTNEPLTNLTTHVPFFHSPYRLVTLGAYGLFFCVSLEFLPGSYTAQLNYGQLLTCLQNECGKHHNDLSSNLEIFNAIQSN